MTEARRSTPRPGLLRWGLGGLGAIGVGLTACSIACSLLVPALLALGAGVGAASVVERGAARGGTVLVALGTLCLALGIAKWLRARRRCARDLAPAPSDDLIACTLNVGDVQRRLVEFREVFERTYVGGEHLGQGCVRWRFRAAPRLEEDLRSLAEKEQRCCRFFRFDIRAIGEEVCWDTRVDRPDALGVLEDFFGLPGSLACTGTNRPDHPLSPDEAHEMPTLTRRKMPWRVAASIALVGRFTRARMGASGR